MASYILNNELGTWREVIQDGADLILVPLEAVIAEETLRDQATTDLATILAIAGVDEEVDSWTRKVIDNSDIVITVDHGNNRVRVSFPEQAWTGTPPATGDDLVGFLLCIDGASDAARRTVAFIEAPVTADDTDKTSNGFASPGYALQATAA